MVLANSRRIPRAPRYSGYNYQSFSYLYRTFTVYGPTFQLRSSSKTSQTTSSYNPECRRNDSGLGYSTFARHYSQNHILFSSPWGTKMFQFPQFASLIRILGLQPSGLPHSEIIGSILVCKYPMLIAAYHVLLRLLEPRHPPFALITFTLVKLLTYI